MPKKRFKISKETFLDWLVSEEDDTIYWGKRFIKDLRENGHIYLSVKAMLDTQESLPAFLFDDQLTEEEKGSFDYIDGIPIAEIALLRYSIT